MLKTNQYNQMMNHKYKNKYQRLKRTIKNYVFENAALCDQIAQIQENIIIIKEERRFLLKKLMDYEDAEIQMLSTAASNNQVTGQQPTVPGKRGPKKRISVDSNASKSKSNSSKTSSSNTTTTAAAATTTTITAITTTSTTTPPIITTNVSSTSKKPSLQQSSNTDGQGHPMFPINLDNNVVIHSIGEIVPDNPNFHTENWIYPVGYVSTRIYSHPREPERKCTFTCKILDNSGTPQFQIIPDSDYDHVFFGESANLCHLRLLETIVHASDIKNLSIRSQGEIFFGLNHKIVKTLLKSSNNFKKCQNFKGFLPDSLVENEHKDPTLNFIALQKLMTASVYHTVPEIKAEPPDELLE